MASQHDISRGLVGDAPGQDALDGCFGVPALVTIDLDAIAANTTALRAHAGSAEVMAVVKADGYGHGLVPSARAAIRGGATWLATAHLSEALALRAEGLSAPILSWLHAPGAPFGEALAHDIDLGVSHPWAVREIVAAASELGRVARLHLKVDTGLGRNGVFVDDVPELIAMLRPLQAEGVVDVVGVFSHFAYADAPGHPTVRAQQETFRRVVADLERAGFPIAHRHLANSAATLTTPSAAFDLVRPGLALYGLSPVPQVGDPASFGLTPAMRVETPVSQVKDLPAGQGVSYGHEYRSATDTLVALLPLGYADGLPRAGGGVAPVLIGGAVRPISGRVCMDQVVVDVGARSTVEAGDRAVVIGDPARGEPSAQDWAEATGTISYEIITRWSGRLPRRYVGGEMRMGDDQRDARKVVP